MKTPLHPALIGFAILVYIFLVGPLIIVLGASVSDTTYLTFPPQGLSLRWFQNIFEISAFRNTMLTSFQLAVLSTALALLIGAWTPLLWVVLMRFDPWERKRDAAYKQGAAKPPVRT